MRITAVVGNPKSQCSTHGLMTRRHWRSGHGRAVVHQHRRSRAVVPPRPRV